MIRPRDRAFFFLLAVSLIAIAACGPSVPTFEPYRRDAGIQCGAGGSMDGGGVGGASCPTGQVCLQGLCYAECSDTNPCGPLETCNAMGVCVGGATDAGPRPDTGPPDPCSTAMCEAPTPMCRNGVCLQCDGSIAGECGGGVPVCDVGRGTCVPFGARVCGPCNTDLDCEPTPGMPIGRCVSRGSPAERVCLPSCEADPLSCPTGFQCDAGVCVPRLALGTCTGMVAALDARGCASDADCAPAGATFSDGLFIGTCFDPGTGTTVCRYPCGVTEDCPVGTCSAEGFCM